MLEASVFPITHLFQENWTKIGLLFATLQIIPDIWDGMFDLSRECNSHVHLKNRPETMFWKTWKVIGWTFCHTRNGHCCLVTTGRFSLAASHFQHNLTHNQGTDWSSHVPTDWAEISCEVFKMDLRLFRWKVILVAPISLCQILTRHRESQPLQSVCIYTSFLWVMFVTTLTDDSSSFSW